MREAVFLVLGDLYLVFGAPSLGDGALAALHAPPGAAALRQLWAVCEDVLEQQVQVRTPSNCMCKSCKPRRYVRLTGYEYA